MSSIQEQSKYYFDTFNNVILGHFNSDEKKTILIVDDEYDNLSLLKRTFHAKYNILTASNGLEGWNVVQEKHDEIALIISDQKMPVMQGTEFLAKVQESYPNIVKIILTGHSDIDILIDSINKCNLFQYIFKPFDLDDLILVVQSGIALYDMEIKKQRMIKELIELFYTTIKSIADALDAKDTYTHGHSLRVTVYSLILANNMVFDEEPCLEELETAGLLHDIGKIGISDNILCKKEKLTDEEFNIMKSHPEQGQKILHSIKKLSCVSDWLKSHHEKWDGSGYPQGLKGNEIPIYSRIIAIADTYDAMTSSRSYRQALSHEQARDEIIRYSGTQFDPDIVEVFKKVENIFRQAKENPNEYYMKYSILQKYLGENNSLDKKIY